MHFYYFSDTTDPIFTRFPDNIVKYIASSNDAPVAVSWTEPTATDDSGVAPTLTPTHTSGTEFDVGIPSATVTYTATDAAGRTAIQSFTISVIVGKFRLFSNSCFLPTTHSSITCILPDFTYRVLSKKFKT